MNEGEAEATQDRQDMRRLADGHDAALDELMARHAGRLRAYLFRLLQNDEDADDLAQESFVRVYRHRADFDPSHSFATWLYSIASNLVKDRFRWRSRHPESPLDSPDPDQPGPARTIPTPEAAPGQALLAEERAKAVRQAVAGLPEDLRVPLVLAEFEDRSHAEIGRILSCSAKAVEMRVYRARHLLRERLARWLAA